MANEFRDNQMSIIKVVHVILNFILWVSYSQRLLLQSQESSLSFQLFGFAIAGIGLWLRIDPKSYEPSNFLDTYNIIHASWIMMVTGFLIIFLCLLGWIAAFTNNPFLMTIVITSNQI